MCLPCPAALPARGVTHSSLFPAQIATRPNHQIIAPNDGAPSTKKRGKGQGLPICARKGFFEAPTFSPKPPEDTLKVPDNPTHPASFLRQFSPRHSPVARPFRGKRGLFAPNARRTRPRRTPDRPVLPRRRPAFSRCAPEKTPAAAPNPGARNSPGGPETPACAAFCPVCARFFRRAPPERPKVAPPAAETAPPCAARRPPPRWGTALGLATPTSLVSFSASPWRSVCPKGGSNL